MIGTIELSVLPGHMGDEWHDVDAAGEAFAEYLKQRLAGEFDAADITVTYRANLSGNAPEYVDGVDAEYVRHVREQAWSEFCDDNDD